MKEMINDDIDELKKLLSEEIPSNRKEKEDLMIKITDLQKQVIDYQNEQIKQIIQSVSLKNNMNLSWFVDNDIFSLIHNSFDKAKEIFHEYNVDRLTNDKDE